MSTTIATITPAQLAGKTFNQRTKLIDVRTPAEFEEIHAQGARSVPLDRLDPKAIADAFKERPATPAEAKSPRFRYRRTTTPEIGARTFV